MFQTVRVDVLILCYRPATPEETTFHLLHLSLFREYLDFEFSALKVVFVIVSVFNTYSNHLRLTYILFLPPVNIVKLRTVTKESGGSVVEYLT